MVRRNEREERAVAGYTFVAHLPAYVCERCDEAVFDYDALHAFNLAIAGKLAELGASSNDAFKLMRTAIGMRAADLAALLDVAPETISRWETGQRSVDRGALMVLGAIVLDQIEGKTRTLDRLRAFREPANAAAEVRIDVRAP